MVEMGVHIGDLAALGADKVVMRCEVRVIT
jgi:hypothetical protein